MLSYDELLQICVVNKCASYLLTTQRRFPRAAGQKSLTNLIAMCYNNLVIMHFVGVIYG